MLGKHGEVTRRLAAVALGGALLVSLGACNTEDENALIVYGPDSAVVVAPLTALGRQAGFSRYLQKPFEPDALVELVHELVAQQRGSGGNA